MARRNKASFQKREREKKKAEKAAMKREMRGQKERSEDESLVASQDDLAAYGLGPEDEGEEPDESRD